MNENAKYRGVVGTPDAAALVAAEVAYQNDRWGTVDTRSDASEGQLLEGALGYLSYAYDSEFDDPPDMDDYTPYPWPKDWDLKYFRDYGSPTANLVVVAALLDQEINRRIAAGEDITRVPRVPKGLTVDHDDGRSSIGGGAANEVEWGQEKPEENMDDEDMIDFWDDDDEDEKEENI